MGTTIVIHFFTLINSGEKKNYWFATADYKTIGLLQEISTRYHTNYFYKKYKTLIAIVLPKGQE